VIILINGIEGAGKGETVKLLNEWMDPRLIEVRTFDQQTDEELARPPAGVTGGCCRPRGAWGFSSATGTAR
jgi:thymidylate kinase